MGNMTLEDLSKIAPLAVQRWREMEDEYRKEHEGELEQSPMDEIHSIGFDEDGCPTITLTDGIHVSGHFVWDGSGGIDSYLL